MKSILFILFNLLMTISLAQTINLTRKKSKNDIKVINGLYNLYFNKSDIIKAIEEIAKIQKTDPEKLKKDISVYGLSEVNLDSSKEKEKNFVQYFKSGMGVFLFMKRQVAVYKNNSILTKINMDSSPPVVDLNGDTKFTVLFTPANSEEQIFLGDINSNLEKSIKKDN